MLSLQSATLAFSGPAAVPAQARAQTQMAAIDDLKVIAKEQNPSIGYYDPLNLAQLNFWNQGDDATVGFLRHAEIKHGRVSMAAFVGFLVQANGVKFPWAPFDQITAASPCEQWDQLPEAAKFQIILFVGFLEVFSEHSFILEAQGQKHYMRGGKPGYFPKFGDLMVHPMPFDLWDPFGFTKGMSAEAKAKSLVAEINNGRLAMIGILGFAAASKGLQVPGLDSVAGIQPYAGEYMAPFTLSDKLAFVPEMLDTFPKFPWF